MRPIDGKERPATGLVAHPKGRNKVEGGVSRCGGTRAAHPPLLGKGQRAARGDAETCVRLLDRKNGMRRRG